MTTKKVQESDVENEQKAPLSRRSFLNLMGATGAAAIVATGTPKLHAVNFINSAKAQFVGMGKWLPTTCQGCTSWCSKQVYVIDGKATKSWYGRRTRRTPTCGHRRHCRAGHRSEGGCGKSRRVRLLFN